MMEIKDGDISDNNYILYNKFIDSFWPVMMEIKDKGLSSSYHNLILI